MHIQNTVDIHMCYIICTHYTFEYGVRVLLTVSRVYDVIKFVDLMIIRMLSKKVI